MKRVIKMNESNEMSSALATYYEWEPDIKLRGPRFPRSLHGAQDIDSFVKKVKENGIEYKSNTTKLFIDGANFVYENLQGDTICGKVLAKLKDFLQAKGNGDCLYICDAGGIADTSKNEIFQFLTSGDHFYSDSYCWYQTDL